MTIISDIDHLNGTHDHSVIYEMDFRPEGSQEVDWDLIFAHDPYNMSYEEELMEELDLREAEMATDAALLKDIDLPELENDMNTGFWFNVDEDDTKAA